MTTKQLLDAHDSVFEVRARLSSGDVEHLIRRQTHHVVGYVDRTPFHFGVDIAIGPRGRVYGKAILVDSRITPATDATQFAPLDDLSRDSLFPLHELCWTADSQRILSVEQLATFVREHLAAIPHDVTALEARFRDISITPPAASVSALEGGATGLRR